ncbi:unnamed protein product [Moneuplotes crassus]|uniref:Uncharacterized protein n=1 Tax=Euplotes crassus TaxID=5936 RepID=A0AAD1UKU0_EUPCR|nr:unnamed protein product [Moneuplotes crassus]
MVHLFKQKIILLKYYNLLLKFTICKSCNSFFKFCSRPNLMKFIKLSYYFHSICSFLSSKTWMLCETLH